MNRPALVALVALLIVSPTQARKPPAERALGVEARIPFADSIGIYDFQADGYEAIWIEDQHRRWYHATLMRHCFDLPFAEQVGFETRGTSTLDRFGAVIVGNDRCPIESLVTSDPPPKKAKKAKPAS
ncbi:MAG: hypothetical protein RL367_463 [Pseudomonadota bacterium]